ncbi:MAG: hypothetical protein HYY93_14680 [Planctomycetes bacterium]|nr:hypothetical protein [Planctomycetota bacterium]
MGTGGFAGKGWSDPREWRATVLDMVEEEADPEMERVLHIDINNLKAPLAVKGWSVIDFFLTEHKSKFLKFLDALREGAKQEDALQQAFGWSIDDLEREWRAFVTRAY